MADNANPTFSKVNDVWGFKTLTDHQQNAMKHVVEEKKDVFVNLPTEFEKSVIYKPCRCCNGFPAHRWLARGAPYFKKFGNPSIENILVVA